MVLVFPAHGGRVRSVGDRVRPPTPNSAFPEFVPLEGHPGSRLFDVISLSTCHLDLHPQSSNSFDLTPVDIG